MRLKEDKIVNKEFLHKWLSIEIPSSYTNHQLITKIKIVKLLKFLKLSPDGSLFVSISDSTNSMFGLITPNCISQYERLNQCRITEQTTNCLIQIHYTVDWISNDKFVQLYKKEFHYHNVWSFAILKISQLNVFDTNQDISSLLKPVYHTMEYQKSVKPMDLQLDTPYID